MRILTALNNKRDFNTGNVEAFRCPFVHFIRWDVCKRPYEGSDFPLPLNDVISTQYHTKSDKQALFTRNTSCFQIIFQVAEHRNYKLKTGKHEARF